MTPLASIQPQEPGNTSIGDGRGALEDAFGDEERHQHQRQQNGPFDWPPDQQYAGGDRAEPP